MKKLTRSAICLIDDGYSDFHMDVHDLEKEYERLRWKEYGNIRDVYDKKYNYI